MRVLVGLICLGLFVVPALAADKIAERVAELELTEDQLFTIGETIFNTEGANTCLKCHGAGGHGGDQVGAADLRHPRTWRVYQALGGDEAFNGDKEGFLASMATVIHVPDSRGRPDLESTLRQIPQRHCPRLVAGDHSRQGGQIQQHDEGHHLRTDEKGL